MLLALITSSDILLAICVMKDLNQSPEQFREILNRVVVLGFIASSVLLFSPTSWLNQLHLNGVMQSHGTFISLIYLVTFCYFLLLLFSFGWNHLYQIIAMRRAERLAEAKASCFDNEERALLREFFLQRTSSLILPIDQDAVQRLLKSCVLQNVESEPSVEPKQRFGIAPTARKFITSNNLRLPVHDLTEDDIRYFKASRPDYIKEQLKQQWREKMRAQRRQAA